MINPNIGKVKMNLERAITISKIAEMNNWSPEQLLYAMDTLKLIMEKTTPATVAHPFGDSENGLILDGTPLQASEV